MLLEPCVKTKVKTVFVAQKYREIACAKSRYTILINLECMNVKIDASWQAYLKSEFEKDYFKKLIQFDKKRICYYYLLP